MGNTTAAHVERLAGNLLRIARAQLDMTQRDLAEAAGVPQSTIARIESGTRQPSLPALARILASVGLQPRISLAVYDSHDDVLDSEVERLTESDRAARESAQDRFIHGLRHISPHG